MFNELVQLLNIAQLMNIKQYYYLEADEEVDVNSTAQVITGDYRVLQLQVITTVYNRYRESGEFLEAGGCRTS